MEVVFLESARSDLQDLRSYLIENFSAEIWRDTYGKLKQAIRRLKNFPLPGSVPQEIKDFGLSHYRQVVSGMNRIVYEVRHDTIFIHMIVDVRRDMTTLLAQRLLRDT